MNNFANVKFIYLFICPAQFKLQKAMPNSIIEHYGQDL